MLENPEIVYLDDPQKQIGTFNDLQQYIQKTRAVMIATMQGIAAIKRGSINSDSIVSILADAKFKPAKNDIRNGFLHTHEPFLLVPDNTSTTTVFSGVCSLMRALKRQLQEKQDDIERQIVAANVHGFIDKFQTLICETGLTNPNDIAAWDIICDLLVRKVKPAKDAHAFCYEIARRIQEALDQEGFLRAVPLEEVDAFIVGRYTYHARDCRTTNTRESEGEMRILKLDQDSRFNLR